ncbi:MAG: adenylate kinase [Chloroflexota bacterium]|nr:adenylate kinase [Chloroflexota bacterium]
MYYILLGAPGAGKGTQAERLHDELGLLHVSSGDLFRENMSNGTPLGIQVKQYLDKGLLVPDDLTVAMVMDAVMGRPEGRAGVLLDGFPRTVGQADALGKALGQARERLACVLHIQVPNDVLLVRLSGRLTCRNCGAMYQKVLMPPKVPGKCDVCGGELYERADDTEETARKRLDVYFRDTAPLIEYYRRCGLLAEVDGNRAVEVVTADLEKAIRGTMAA